jgi:glycosyltransferase involved in cell wall biosynthesis
MDEVPMPAPKVSVIIPTHNRPDLLKRAIQSVLDQTFEDLEIIVVNDHGADISNVLSCFQDDRLIFVTHLQHLGVSAARNTGIALSRGSHICYLDDDDIFYPNHVEVLYSHLVTTGLKCVYSDAINCSAICKNGEVRVFERRLKYSHDPDRDALLASNRFPVLCFMHARECLDKAGYFDESLKAHEDFDLWLSISAHYEFSHIKDITCEFTTWLDRNSLSDNRKIMLETLVRVYGKHPTTNVKVLHRRKIIIRGLVNEIAFIDSLPRMEELAAMLESLGEFSEAETMYKSILRARPTAKECRMRLVKLLKVQHRHAEALAILNEGREILLA